MRHKSDDQGTSLTSKGQTAKGKRFYSGHIYTRYNTSPTGETWNNFKRSHFVSVMATEDSTVVTFDMIKAPINYIGQTAGEPITVTLNALESYVIGIDHSAYVDSTINLSNGTRITSTKPIVCNTGSWLAGNELGQCIGSDQIVPAEITGQEYILVKGLGDESTERPIVIATTDNTDVYLNDGTTPVATLDEGEFFIVPTADFTANNNMYILATEKVYVYQTLSGSTVKPGPTVGLSFIPPLNCIGAKEVNLPFVNSLATPPLGQGRVNIITKVGTSIYVNENPTPLTGAQAVTGNTDWVTYSFNPSTENVIIESDSVMNVALLTEDDNVGTAGYFSGFTLEPVVGLSSGISGTLPCIPGNAILQVFGFDSYQWYFNNEAIPGATDNTLFPEFSGAYKVEGIDEACGFVFPSNSFSIPFCPSTLGAAKKEESVTETSPGSKIFDVEYRLYIKNYAVSPSTNIQVIENINGGLPLGASAQLIVAPTFIGTLSGVTNAAFDGVTDRKILSGTGALPGGGEAVITLVVRVDMNAALYDGYFNQVTTTSKNGIGPNDGVTGPFNGQDFSHNGNDPDPNGDGDPNQEGENDYTLTCFFPNTISYEESEICFNQDSALVEINGISSGQFTTNSSGLALDSVTGTIYPSQSTVGTHIITYTVPGVRCDTTITTAEITIVAGPSAGTVVENTAICLGTDPVNLANYLENESPNGVWTNVNGDTVVDVFNPSAVGDFEFTYTVTTAPCAAESQMLTLSVLTAPNAGEVVENLTVCLSVETIDLYSFISGEQAGGQWTDENGNPTSASINLTESGVFGYTYTSNIEGCGSESVSFEITVKAEPDAGVPLGTATLCEDQNINLFDYLVDSDLSGDWFDQQGNISNDEISAGVAGTYTYTYIVSNPPCDNDTSEISFEVVEGPSAGNPVNPYAICVSDPTLNLIELIEGASPGGVWTNDDAQEVSGIFDPQVIGIYTFTYTVSSPECGDIESDVILDVAGTYCDNREITIPQGFSPNGDGIGDKWEVMNLEQYPNNTLLIFNRWGAEVFSASPYTNNWEGRATDGLNSSGGLPVGTYWYLLDLGNGSDTRKGYIYLNR